MTAVLLVDAANVVGSRPDGWWRDRPAAAARLVQRLSDWLPAGPERQVAGVPVQRVVVVLEGQARAGVPERTGGQVEVVHAPGPGDDELAARCGPGILLVTADRALAGRGRAAGADVVGPRSLLDVLDAAQPGAHDERA